ncbi:MAG: xanthine dehydrogenase family protein subunit M [Anaerolineae bacterium]|nr:xanthine dehydrogenase family protein subunit M [Anaerolineae bacterium]MDQ7035963.1 xanthine dehydrogenase family protein subunit M [Anaerolineae bacterium]
MWPKEFDYVRASSVDDAIQQTSDNTDAKILAGGHSLLPAMKLRLSEPGKLVDISRLADLKGISANGTLSIGAMSTHAEIAASADVQQYCASLATACGMVGDHQVRNFGTLGGNIAHADPASDPPTVLVAAGATIHIKRSRGERSVSAEDFFIDLFTTDLEDGEVITRIEVPNLSGHKAAYVKMPHPASRYAIVGVAVILEMDGDTCKSARVAVGGATVSAMRASGAESALSGSSLDDAALNAAASAVQSDISDALMGDVSYPESYRQAMSGVYLKRAVKAALG